MHKGIILKIENEYMIILSETGIHEKIQYKSGATIGQSIYYFSEDIVPLKKKHNLFPIIRFVAMAAVIMIAFVFSQTDEKNLAYLTIDINPSIELIIGKDHIVTSALALNSDAETFNLEHYKGLSIQNALAYLISEAQQLGYINPEEKSAEIAIGYIPASKKAASFVDLQNDIKTVHDNIRLTQTLQNLHIRLFEATENELNASLKAKETLSKWVYEHASIPRNQTEFEAPQSKQNLPKDVIEENADTDTSPKTDDADNGTETTAPVNTQPDATTQATDTQIPTTTPDATTSATTSSPSTTNTQTDATSSASTSTNTNENDDAHKTDTEASEKDEKEDKETDEYEEHEEDEHEDSDDD